MLLLEDKYGKMMKIFNKFIKSQQFGVYESSDENVEVGNIADYLYFHHNELTVANGISKAVLISKEVDSVLKVPFLGMWYENYNEETGDYDEYWEEFYGVPDGDYCMREVEVYEAAEEAGVEMFFAKTEFFGMLDCGLPVYKQVKVVPLNETDFSKIRKPSEKSVSKVEELYNYEACDLDWKALALDYYGEELLKKFFDFINNDFPACGEDMHRGNYGYTLDGRPVLLDYSGYES